MWKWFNCYLSGRHDFGVWCEPGAIFLRCMHCGKRSHGWAIDPKAHTNGARAATPGLMSSSHPARVLPFGRAATR